MVSVWIRAWFRKENRMILFFAHWGWNSNSSSHDASLEYVIVLLAIVFQMIQILKKLLKCSFKIRWNSNRNFTYTYLYVNKSLLNIFRKLYEVENVCVCNESLKILTKFVDAVDWRHKWTLSWPGICDSQAGRQLLHLWLMILSLLLSFFPVVKIYLTI